jgi:hypothetical protein
MGKWESKKIRTENMGICDEEKTGHRAESYVMLNLIQHPMIIQEIPNRE